MSSSEITKSNTSRFACMRAGEEDLGSGATPHCRANRTHSCATDLPYFAAMPASRSSCKTRVRPSGLHASGRMPCALQNSTV